MNKYVEKLKSARINFGLWKSRSGEPRECPESGWSYQIQEKKQKGWTASNWPIVALPLVAFLCLGIYFVLVDVKVLTSVADKNPSPITNSSESSWWNPSEYQSAAEGHPENSVDHPRRLEGEEEEEEGREEEDEEDPNLIVRFDYVDLSEEDLPTDGQFVHDAFDPNATNSKETLIILKNDDSGKKIFLKTSSAFREAKGSGSAETTTAKAFVYSPTIPQSTAKKAKVDATTKKYNHTDDSRCFSTKLGFCEGILPYDVVQLPGLPSVKRYGDLAAVLPYFQMIVDSGCSLRAREFICSVLEPECQPEGLKARLPCKLNCKVVSDDCKDFILQTLPLSKIFDCRRYPDWDEAQDCLNVSKGKCHDEEFRCSDGTCIPSKWVCDGVHDCPGSRPSFDETNCQGCSRDEFRCVMDGKCVPLHWKCDGQTDCADHSDEMSC